MTVADPEQSTPKDKPVTYIEALVKLCNWKNGWQVYEIYGIIELEKMCTSTAENLHNFDIYRIIKISLVLRSAYMIPRDQEKFVFYINNFID